MSRKAQTLEMCMQGRVKMNMDVFLKVANEMSTPCILGKQGK